MSNLVPISGALPSILRPQGITKNELGAGIASSFAILTIRGKVWRIKHRGEEVTLMNQEKTGPLQYVDVIIVKASPTVAKIYYPGGYKEGSNDAPDCWSVDGQKPDPAAPKKQCETCAGCTHNIWGSRLTDDGKKGKACADSKRLVVVPAFDMKNEMFGGPMLLRVPAASLGDMATYGADCERQGAPYYGVVTRLSFDIEAAYPKLVFSAIRYLTDNEAVEMLALQGSPQTHRILSEAVDFVRAEIGVAGAPGVPQGPAGQPSPVLAQAQPVNVGATTVQFAGVTGVVPPNPFAANTIAQPTVVVAQPQPSPVPQPVTAAPAVAFGGGSTVSGGMGFAGPTVAQPVQVQPLVIDVEVEDVPKAVPVGETMEQKIERLTAELAAAKTKKTRVRNPKPANEVSPGPATQATVSPVTPQPVVQVQAVQADALSAQPGAGAASLAELDNAIANLV